MSAASEVGIDIIETVRIKGVLERHDARFLSRVYTEWEQRYCRHNVLHLAGRWAAKEAVSKVLGLGVRVGGSQRYPGACLLASRAAARCGAGVVTVAAARSVVEMIGGQDPNITFFPLAEAQPGVVATGAAAQLSPLLAEKIRAVLVGPGLAHAPGTDDFVVAVLRNARAGTTIVDADGLNALARTEDWPSLLSPRTILTPHDGEAAR